MFFPLPLHPHPLFLPSVAYGPSDTASRMPTPEGALEGLNAAAFRLAAHSFLSRGKGQNISRAVILYREPTHTPLGSRRVVAQWYEEHAPLHTPHKDCKKSYSKPRQNAYVPGKQPPSTNARAQQPNIRKPMPHKCDKALQ